MRRERARPPSHNCYRFLRPGRPRRKTERVDSAGSEDARADRRHAPRDPPARLVRANRADFAKNRETARDCADDGRLRGRRETPASRAFETQVDEEHVALDAGGGRCAHALAQACDDGDPQPRALAGTRCVGAVEAAEQARRIDGIRI